MKKKIFNTINRALWAFIVVVSSLSCKDMFDIKPETAVDHEQAYQHIFDADAAVIGVYGKFVGLAEQHVVLNELRGDLINTTENAAANPDLLELNYHDVSEGNRYADPKPYYEVILNCNDVMENLEIMLEENKIEQAQFEERYSDIGALRSWLYLQLGINYGEVPYVTEALSQVDDLYNQSKFPVLQFDDLLDHLIQFMESLPSKENYSANSSLVTNIDGFNTQKFFINKKLVLADLYLWKGNYTQAATYYRAIMETASNAAGEDFYMKHKIAWGTYAFDLATAFTGSQTRAWDHEWIWDLPFSPNFSPKNPFYDLFSNVNGQYLLKPSESIMEMWDQENRTDNTPVDPRAFQAARLLLGVPVAYKYLHNMTQNILLDKPGNWFLARATMVHLRFAEAANRDGKHRVAYALLNQGIQFTYDPNPDVANRDVSNIQQTHEPPPYDFDAREGDYPYFRGPWYRGVGIRGRMGLTPLDGNLQFESDSTMIIENALVKEAALDLAFEGHRWQDLLRIAMRRNDPAFLADKVYEKLHKAGDPRAAEVRDRLMNRENWFLPFKW